MSQTLGLVRIGRTDLPLEQGLSLSWSRGEATARRASYQRALGFALLVETALAIYAIVAPNSLSVFLGLPVPQPAGWVSALGGLILIAAVLQLPGLLDPVRRRWPNVIGIPGRLFVAVIFLFAGGGFIWLAILEALLALMLVFLYYRLFLAELMSRP